jgi:hypothetical protein
MRIAENQSRNATLQGFSRTRAMARGVVERIGDKGDVDRFRRGVVQSF